MSAFQIKFYDLSLKLDDSPYSLEPFKIKYINHKWGAFLLGLSTVFTGDKLQIIKNFIQYTYKTPLKLKDFPGNEALAWEFVYGSTHAGTHIDAPYHYGSYCNNKKAKTIEEIDLSLFYSDGVVLDMRHKSERDTITISDLAEALEKIKYTLKPFDIVMLQTGYDKYWGTKRYLNGHPGMNRGSTLWLLDQGIKVIGTDAYSIDRPFIYMLNDYFKDKDKNHLWPCHILGREREYYHIEKLANLDLLPKKHGFKVICFPTTLKNGSAGWARVVAMVD